MKIARGKDDDSCEEVQTDRKTRMAVVFLVVEMAETV